RDERLAISGIGAMDRGYVGGGERVGEYRDLDALAGHLRQPPRADVARDEIGRDDLELGSGGGEERTKGMHEPVFLPISLELLWWSRDDRRSLRPADLSPARQQLADGGFLDDTLEIGPRRLVIAQGRQPATKPREGLLAPPAKLPDRDCRFAVPVEI